MIFRAGSYRFDLRERVLVMGILNVTPDSFSDGAAHDDPRAAVAHGLALIAAGADIVDVGGESTRPGAAPVSAAEERRRVVPVIAALRAATTVPISVDTYKADVAAAALAAGADIVNDISGFRRDPELKLVAARAGAGCIAMHMRGTPQTMQQLTGYHDLVGEVATYFAESVALLVRSGVKDEYIALDPGIGFSKTAEQNLELIAKLDRICGLGRPVLLGTSRKSFIGKALGLDNPIDRDWGTAATVVYGIVKGARLVRVHDVAHMRQVVDMTLAIEAAKRDLGNDGRE